MSEMPQTDFTRTFVNDNNRQNAGLLNNQPQSFISGNKLSFLSQMQTQTYQIMQE